MMKGVPMFSKKVSLFFCVFLLMLSGVSVAAGLSDKEQLGKDIFSDSNLSAGSNQSCATCHASSMGWTGPTQSINEHGAVYEGSISGRFGNRKPPSSAYATLSPVLYYSKQAGGLFVGGNFWDGRATGEKLGNPAADQAQGPFLNPLEQALSDAGAVVSKVCSSSYSGLFQQVCGTSACDPGNVSAAYDCIALSIAAYEASSEVNAFTSKFDAYLAGKATLTKEEKNGLALFNGKARCAQCHVSKGKAPLFTDFTYDNLGVPRNPENPFYTEINFNPLGAAWIDLGLGEFLASRVDYAQYANVNYGNQKVPTLRNVDKRPNQGFVKAYSHNGYFKSLQGIVHFYNTRDVLPKCPGNYTEAQALAANCWPLPELALNMNTKQVGNLGLTPAEEEAIVAFLQTLSDQP
jgi:cytochrome c peroxidase